MICVKFCLLTLVSAVKAVRLLHDVLQNYVSFIKKKKSYKLWQWHTRSMTNDK